MNTRDNRASAIGIGMAWRPNPLADGTVSVPDRQHAALCYRAIAAGLPFIQVADDSRTIIVQGQGRLIIVDLPGRTIQ